MRSGLAVVTAWIVAAVAPSGGAEPAVPLFEKDVLPILKAHCFQCHGIDSPKGELDLRTRASILQGGKNGVALTPGSLKESPLWLVVATDTMPATKEKLSDEQKDVLRRWVLAGAPGEGVAASTTQPTQKSASGRPAVKQGVAAVARLVDEAIDRQLKQNNVPASPQADDAEFLRRAYLDLTGRIPPADRVRAFLSSTEPDKRAKLIDELLTSPDHGKHLSSVFAALFAAEEPARRPALEAWLAEVFNANRGWHEVARTLLTAETGGEVGFILGHVENNQPDPGKLAGATARLFLGVQLQCAECHNHPFTEWKQTDFWSLAAFFSRTKVRKAKPGGVEDTAPAKDPTRVAIAIPTTAGRAAGTMVPARFPLGDEVKFGDKPPYRAALADWLTADDNPFFARAAVNRFWSLLFGKGLTNPVDDLDETNPPTHPEVLQVLADEFRASGFDVRHLIRCLTATRAYQRSSKPLPANAKDEVLYSRQSVKTMSGEMLYDSLVQALGVKQLTITVPVSGTTSGRKSRVKSDARTSFIEFFDTRGADVPATEYTHGIIQALSLLNDPSVTKQAPLLDALTKNDSAPEAVIDGLYLATLSRPPSADERARLLAYVNRRPDRRQAYAGVLWLLLNTPEFVLVR